MRALRPSCGEDNLAITMEDTLLEVSGTGKGDLRSPMIEVTFADGSKSLDFIYKSFELLKEIPKRETLPGSYTEGAAALGDANVLRITMMEREGIVEKSYGGATHDLPQFPVSGRLVGA